MAIIKLRDKYSDIIAIFSLNKFVYKTLLNHSINYNIDEDSYNERRYFSRRSNQI